MRATRPAIVVAILLLAGTRVHAQSLNEAKELYASAEYDRALAMLEGLTSSDERRREELQAIEIYRILCLVATGREADARGVIEALVTKDPLFHPSNDLPPRVRTTYSETRKKMLPSAAQSAYQEAKAAFDFKDYSTAERGFALVLQVLSDPDVEPAAGKSPLADIKTLAAGFHELSAKAAAPPAPVVQALPQTPVVPELPVPPPVPRAPKVYSSNDLNVVPPIAMNQQIPPFRGQIRGTGQSGVLEVLIDALGSVESASMVTSINPQYDRLAVGATKSWQYQPARLDGVPVKFVKRIQVNLVPAGN